MRFGTELGWRARVAAGGAAILGLSLIGAAPNAGALSAADAGARGSSEVCLDNPGARVKEGVNHGADPNSLSATEARAMNKAFKHKVANMRKHGRLNARRQAKGHNIHIKTYFHVITKTDGTGSVTQEQINDQMQVLNAGFRGTTSPEAVDTHFRFVLSGVDYVANDDWYAWGWLGDAEDDDREAKKATHVGNWRTLNVWVTDFDPPGLLGYATFPKSGPLKLDGVVILNESMPGGTAAPYNEGDTLTHEVGHWMNLYHTFQDGCEFPGDEVRDTPYQLDGDNIFFCEESDDTCPQPGTDPVHNFMAYGDDPCLNEFTAGQARRMFFSWLVYRAKRH